MWEKLHKLLAAHSSGIEERQSATVAFKKNAGGVRMRCRDRGMLGLSLSERDGWLYRRGCIQGPQRAMLTELDTQDLVNLFSSNLTNGRA